MSFNWDPSGPLMLELRSDVNVAAIAGANPSSSPARVRVREPAPKTSAYDGDAHGPGAYRAFVVIQALSGLRMKRVPVQQPRFVARCYGRNSVEADQLARAVSDAIHYIRSRVAANGLGIYTSFDDGGGEQDKDPDTNQPLVNVLISLTATTQVIA